MSADAQDAVDNALRSLFLADSQLQAEGLTGAWEGQAPQSSVPTTPYIIMIFAGLPDEWAHDGPYSGGFMATIKGVDLGHATGRAGAIDERVRDLIDGKVLQIDGLVSYLVQRERPMPRYTTTDGQGRVFKHIGGMYRMTAKKL